MSAEFWDIVVKVGLSALLAGLVGAEREWTGKAAGLRTHMLIAVGAALLTDVSVDIGDRFAIRSGAWDPGRISAQIVSGVGFLGAGTIIQARGGVRGLTTAAGLWVAAALGLAVGARFYAEATVTSVVLFGILVLLRPVENRLLRRGGQEISLELAPGRQLAEVTGVLDEAKVEVDRVKVQEYAGYRLVEVLFRGGAKDRERVVRRLEEGGFEVGGDGGGRWSGSGGGGGG